MNPPEVDWQKIGDDCVSELVHELELLDHLVKSNDLSDALLNPKERRRLVQDHRTTGRRRTEGKWYRDRLRDIGYKSIDSIASEIEVERTTVSRALDGESYSSVFEDIRNRFRVEFSKCMPPTEDQLWIQGYCYAIERIRADLDEICGTSSTCRPRNMTEEEFCYVWHTLNSEEWARALEADSFEQLDAAAASIHKRVVDPLFFPTSESRNAKLPGEILDICGNWDVAFFIAVYSTVDVLKFRL